MKPFIERTEDHLYTTWADINWHGFVNLLTILPEP